MSTDFENFLRKKGGFLFKDGVRIAKTSTL